MNTKIKCPYCSGTGSISEEIYKCQCGWSGAKPECEKNINNEYGSFGAMTSMQYCCPKCKAVLDIDTKFFFS